MAKQIVVDISPAGKTKVEAIGFNGVGCDKATEMIEIAVGGGAQKTKKKKPEYHTPGGQKTSAKQVF